MLNCKSLVVKCVSFLFLLSDVDVLIVMVTNEVQAESVLYGVDGAVSGMSEYNLSFCKLT